MLKNSKFNHEKCYFLYLYILELDAHKWMYGLIKQLFLDVQKTRHNHRLPEEKITMTLGWHDVRGEVMTWKQPILFLLLALSSAAGGPLSESSPVQCGLR